MDIMIESVLEPVLTALMGIIGAAVAAGGTLFVRWINRRTKNDTLNEYTSMLVFYAQKAVMSVAQAEADVLKAAASDGKLTGAEKQRMKDTAMRTLKDMAPDAILKFMSRANSDVDKLLETLVEAEVHEKNNGGNS